MEGRIFASFFDPKVMLLNPDLSVLVLLSLSVWVESTEEDLLVVLLTIACGIVLFLGLLNHPGSLWLELLFMELPG